MRKITSRPTPRPSHKPRPAIKPRPGKSPAGRSFDRSNFLAIQAVTSQATVAGNSQAVWTATVAALTSRLTMAQGLLAVAQTKAQAADAAYDDGLLATQTALNALREAVAANADAVSISESMDGVFQEAYTVARRAVVAAQAVTAFGLSVGSITTAQVQTVYLSSTVVGDVSGVQTAAQNALTAALAALEAAMNGAAYAAQAVQSSAALIGECLSLLEVLLPLNPPAPSKPNPSEIVQPKQKSEGPVDWYSKITNLRNQPLYTPKSTPLISDLAKDVAGGAGGLLFLLDGVKKVADFREDEFKELNAQISVELNLAQHTLDQKTLLHNTLEAAVNAATAVVS